jgi:hypothetical protein
MVLALHKFNHYLLGNKFVFYVDHMASSHIARWLLLFVEYEFTIVYKLRCTHVMVNTLSRIPNIIELTNVPNQTTNVILFHLQLV